MENEQLDKIDLLARLWDEIEMIDGGSNIASTSSMCEIIEAKIKNSTPEMAAIYKSVKNKIETQGIICNRVIYKSSAYDVIVNKMRTVINKKEGEK